MPETRTFEIAGARIAVHTAGSGPHAVLLHGFPLDHRMWRDVQAGELARHRTLHAIDLRGHGDSPPAGDEVHSMERLADDVAGVILQLSDDPVDVGGLSMGGYVALALHARHRALVRSLVLSNTRAGADSQQQQKGREAGIELATSRGAAAVADAMLPKLVGPGASADVQQRLREMIEATPTETIVADQRGMMQRPDRHGELAGIAVPTLVVTGEHDSIVRHDEADAMAKAVQHARFCAIADTGHMSPMEDAAAWSEVVQRFWTAG